MSRSSYERRKARREVERQRAFHGETLAQYHARETAKPPTLAEIFAKNRADKARCPWTPSLLDWNPKRRRARKINV